MTANEIETSALNVTFATPRTDELDLVTGTIGSTNMTMMMTRMMAKVLPAPMPEKNALLLFNA